MSAEWFTSELGCNGALASVVRRYTQAFVSQVSQQFACNALQSIEEHLALTHDRVEKDGFPLTQQFLPQLLGVGGHQ